MKVAILTEGGKGIGFGHVARCGALYQALAEKDAKPELVVNGDDSVRSLIKGKTHKIFNWLKEKDKLSRVMLDAEVIIIDSYLAGPDFYKHLSMLADLAVYIDDNKRINYPKGIVANGNIHAGMLKYPKRDDIFYLLGPRYVPLRKEFWTTPSKCIKKNMESAVITFGGDDSRNLTLKVLKFLVDDHPELIKNVIVGKGFRDVKRLKKLKYRKTNLVYNPDTGLLRDIMAGSDIAICAGGQTLYELAKVGTPAIVIGLADNQLNNIKMWEKAGFIEYAGWWEDARTINNVSKCLNRMKRQDRRKEMVRIGKTLVDGKGARRIVQEILKAN